LEWQARVIGLEHTEGKIVNKQRSREEVPAHLAFQAKRQELTELDLRDRFARIYETNLWGSEESRSGTGSEGDQTLYVRQALPGLLQERKVRSFLDIPCGDFAWMRHVPMPGVDYIGADIVPVLVDANQSTYGHQDASAMAASRNFRVLDLTSDPLPTVDLVFCRDCLVHLSFAHILAAFANLKRSGSRWLLTTTFPDHDRNEDIEDGDWRLLNFEKAPFLLPPPLDLINEGCSEQDGKYADKSLGLWSIEQLPTSL
jgi:SAM-dependent methyltransferase